MSIPLTTAGGLFTRLGHWVGGLDDINALQGAAATARVLAAANWLTRAAQIETDYAAAPANQPLVDGVYSQITSMQNSLNGFANTIASFCQATMIKMADQDTPLSSKDYVTALKLLISQMTGVATVQASVVAAGAQTNVGTPNGNPVIVASVKDGTGRSIEYAIAETITFACTADSQQGLATLNQEPLSIKGTVAAPSQLSYLWPLGSNASSSQNAIDASVNNSAPGNLLNNSSFETWTSNIPGNWTVQIGTPGTTIIQDSAVPYDGTSDLKFAGNGAELTSITQDFNSTTGTSYKLKPNTQYAWNCWVRVDAAAPAAGVLEVALVDNALAIMNDAQGVANSKTLSLPGQTSTYAAFNGTFRTPNVLPNSNTALKLRIRLSTALTNTKNVFIDRFGFAEMKQLYSGGPSFSIFSGNTKLIAADSWTIGITNTLGLFQKAFQRLFDMRSNGLILPSSGGPTISDTLIA